jgi:hypothetical protein
MRRTDEDLEQVVAKTLDKLGLGFVPNPDMMTVITKLKHTFPGFNYARVPDAEMPDAYAQYDSEKQVVRMRESTFVGMQRGEARARMTVFEEISHFILGHKGVLNRSVGKTISERAVDQTIAQEAEAKRCAAIFAAPQYQLPDDVNAEYLMKAHSLSFDAASIRLDRVERLRRRARGEHRQLPTSIVNYLEERKRRGV